MLMVIPELPTRKTSKQTIARKEWKLTSNTRVWGNIWEERVKEWSDPFEKNDK